MRHVALALLAAGSAAPAAAQDDPRFCPNRPDLGSSGCTTAPGEVLVEWSAFDWQRDTATDTTDTMLAADTLVRIGAGPSTEVQIGWAPFVRQRTRDATTGAVDVVRGVSDLRLGVRQALGPPDGDGWSLAIEPYVVAPVAKKAIGTGAWDFGVVVPASYDLGQRWQVSFTAIVDARPNEMRAGRHLDASGTVGLGYQLADKVTLVGELAVERDDDPDAAKTQLLAAGSIAWQPTKRFQLDVLAVAGLNRDAPDVRLVTGGAILF